MLTTHHGTDEPARAVPVAKAAPRAVFTHAGPDPLLCRGASAGCVPAQHTGVRDAGRREAPAENAVEQLDHLGLGVPDGALRDSGRHEKVAAWSSTTDSPGVSRACLWRLAVCQPRGLSDDWTCRASSHRPYSYLRRFHRCPRQAKLRPSGNAQPQRTCDTSPPVAREELPAHPRPTPESRRETHPVSGLA